MELEGDIIKEMMDIVAKRDSLITLLEEDRLRCFNKRRSSDHELFRSLAIFEDEDSSECFYFMLLFVLAYVVSVLISYFVLNMHV